MKKYLEIIPYFVEELINFREIIITNIILVGQIPAPTFGEKKRAEYILDRMAEFNIAECTTDSYGNPVAIVRGTSKTKPPIFIAAHIDTFVNKDVDHFYSVSDNTINGPGVADNSASVRRFNFPARNI